MIQVEKKNIVGILHTQGRSFEMLELNPWKHEKISVILREHSFQFLVVVDDFAQPVIVGRGDYLIVPLIETYERDVNYLVEGDIEANTENPTRIVV